MYFKGLGSECWITVLFAAKTSLSNMYEQPLLNSKHREHGMFLLVFVLRTRKATRPVGGAVWCVFSAVSCQRHNRPVCFDRPSTPPAVCSSHPPFTTLRPQLTRLKKTLPELQGKTSFMGKQATLDELVWTVTSERCCSTASVHGETLCLFFL